MHRAATFPPRLGTGSHVRVVAPARSLDMIGPETRRYADQRLAELGLEVSFGAHVDECDDFVSSSVAARVDDLHAAFADESVDAILTVIGGYNSHQLLPYLDWDLIAGNPKILCGYSDITALQNAIWARTGLVTYSGPHYSTFGMRDHVEDTLRWFIDCVFTTGELDLTPAATWSDDTWFLDQDDRTLHRNDGWWRLGEGAAEGRLIGGNASTFALLNGTPYAPGLHGGILFLEDDDETQPHHVDRCLTSILQQPDADLIRALVIGRFQAASVMTGDLLAQIVANHPRLAEIPVVANVDFGHTNPMITFPVGGLVAVEVGPASARITILEH